MLLSGLGALRSELSWFQVRVDSEQESGLHRKLFDTGKRVGHKHVSQAIGTCSELHALLSQLVATGVAGAAAAGLQQC